MTTQKLEVPNALPPEIEFRDEAIAVAKAAVASELPELMIDDASITVSVQSPDVLVVSCFADDVSGDGLGHQIELQISFDMHSKHISISK